MSYVPNESFNMAINREQGYGFTQVSGSFPMPEARTGTLTIIDSNNQPRHLVLDYQDGVFYEISTRDGPSGTGLTRVWKDKVSKAGSGGVDIAPSVTFREDTGEFERYRIRFLNGDYYVRPYDEDNRNESGYDSNGYLTDTEFQSVAYVDGEPTTVSARAEDIENNNSFVYDRVVEGRRIQSTFSSNKSSMQLLSRQHDFIVKDIENTQTTKRVTTEGIHQSDINNPLFWITRGNNLLFERVSGSTITASGSTTAVAGPDENTESAFQTSGVLVFPSVSTVSSKTIMLWGSGNTPTVTMGGSPIPLTSYDSSGSWNLFYSSGINTSGVTIITPSGTNGFFSIRMCLGSTVDDLQYYFRDITENNGDNTEPLF